VAGKIIAAIIFIRELMAVAAYAVLIGVSAIGADAQVLLASAVACLAMFARVFDAPELWFQANLRAKEPAVIRMAVAITFFALRLGVLIFAPNIMTLLILFVCEQLVNSIGIYLRYALKSQGRLVVLPESGEVKFLWKSAAPLIISTVANQVNL